MNKIESLEQYKALKKMAKDNDYKLSNCYFMPDVLQQKITAGVLYTQEIEKGVLILEDCNMFYRCYYYLSYETPKQDVVLEKDAVIEFPFNSVLNAKQETQISLLESFGFTLGRNSGLMKAEKKNVVNQYFKENDYKYESADPEDAIGILDLLYKTFNPLYAFLPTENELGNLINENKVIVVRDNQSIAGALISNVDKQTASIMQLAVNDKYRRQGIAKKLVQDYHNKYINDVDSFQHWVDLENRNAINLYQNFGYEFTLRKANEYILLKEGEKR